MITLEEAISHVQTAGTMKYPYLKRVKVDSFLKFIFPSLINRNYLSPYLRKIL